MNSGTAEAGQPLVNLGKRQEFMCSPVSGGAQAERVMSLSDLAAAGAKQECRDRCTRRQNKEGDPADIRDPIHPFPPRRTVLVATSPE
jgi:hypothetical protein